MEKLNRVLKLLKNVDYVNRPKEQMPELPPEEEETMGATLPGQEATPQNKAISPNAIDSMLTSLSAGQPETGGLTTPEPTQTPETPAKKRLKYLNLQDQIQKSKFPEMTSNPMLGGGAGGLRI